MKTWQKILLIILTLGIAYLTIRLVFNKGKSISFGNKASCDSSFLFVGDSLTAFDQSYADQLLSICANLNYKKIAVVGKKTDWMLDQLTTELATNKYDVISIWGGVNDIYATGSIANAESNLQALYDMAKQSGAKVVGLTVIPTRTYNISTDATVSLTNQLNNWILTNPSLDAVIDVNAIVNDGNEGTKSQYLQPDTLHLTSSAQALISKDFANKVIK